MTDKNLPNAPQTQPCPTCTAWVKRVAKSMKTATYYCRRCKLTNIISLPGKA